MKTSNFFQTEYLVILDYKSVGALFSFIDCPQRFNEFLKKAGGLKVQNNSIVFSQEKFIYKIRHGEVPEKEQRYFYISIATTNNDFKNYVQLLKVIKKVVLSQSFIIESLQDDLSFYYSNRAYAMIHEIENMMRKFITFFMITNVGKEWVSQNISSDVKTALAKSKHRDYASELQKLDFKDLGSILFNTYQIADNQLLYDKIDSYRSADEIDLGELKKFIPKSNWNVFFKDILNCDGPQLKKNWSELYGLRNTVAHTSSLSEFNYHKIKDLVDELKPILNEAFKNLDKLQLESSERKAISERVATTLDSKVGVYFDEINNLEKEIRDLLPEEHNLTLDEVLEKLVSNKSLEMFTAEKLRKLVELKDNLSFESIPSAENIVQIESQINELRTCIQETWSKEVYKYFVNLGGSATLERVYNEVVTNTHRKLFGSWKTSVRRAIYSNSSDADLFEGKFDIYKRVGKGKWMLRKDLNEELIHKFLNHGG
ncbi:MULTISPECIES: Swt1 family HEPN domain-containing protein [unclassified Pseudoalteromonas]|uniref:Swt1 family HEPN domain-containing protein n=1 Tax=unclassified Pseudoalteromonas TaxID=194690 RepID=UPI0025B4D2CA|nr:MULTISPECIES: Swt1 family HEPN domain-containing protein [unclassified Pseudoalteromonas]MDN3380594.1 Swt1 family HEPN domain-containing protein [Pseudoalteromonas sp. APC 3893]MDN3388894.1 Swt1 family HEPN domain-containing protein [Pseudoalteromonas sp. APC 4017]